MITIKCNHCGATVTTPISEAIAWDAEHQKEHTK